MVSWEGSLVEPMPDNIFPLDGLNQQLAEHVTSTGSSANTIHTHIYNEVSLHSRIYLFISKPANSLSACKV